MRTLLIGRSYTDFTGTLRISPTSSARQQRLVVVAVTNGLGAVGPPGHQCDLSHSACAPGPQRRGCAVGRHGFASATGEWWGRASSSVPVPVNQADGNSYFPVTIPFMGVQLPPNRGVGELLRVPARIFSPLPVFGLRGVNLRRCLLISDRGLFGSGVGSPPRIRMVSAFSPPKQGIGDPLVGLSEVWTGDLGNRTVQKDGLQVELRLERNSCPGTRCYPWTKKPDFSPMSAPA